MKREAGFSLLQVSVAITLIGLLGAVGTAKLGAAMKARALEGEIRNWAWFARESRAIGIKKNLPVGILFDKARGRCRMFEDANRNGRWDVGESARDLAWGSRTALGPGSKVPPYGPGGTSLARSGLAGAWTGGLVFGGDALATPNQGEVCLHQLGLESMTACLVRSADSPQIRAYLWDGAAWRSL